MVRVGRPIRVRTSEEHKYKDLNIGTYIHFYKLYLHLVKSLKKTYAEIDEYVDKKGATKFPENEIDDYLELVKRIRRTEKQLAKRASIYAPAAGSKSIFLSVHQPIRRAYKRLKKLKRWYNKKGYSGVEKLWFKKSILTHDEDLFYRQTYKKIIEKSLKSLIFYKSSFRDIYDRLK